MRTTATVAGICLALASSVSAHKPTVTTFTYHEDIYPIFAEKCGSCHRNGGVAPMSLLSYDEAHPWGVAIKNQVLSLTMPPWFADERYGVFKHDGALTAKEIDTIVDWCLGGSPEGEAPGPSADASRGDDPNLREPDLELVLPSPVVLDESTSESRETVILETGLDETVYVRAIDFRPDAANIVRSATLRVEGEDVPFASWIPGQGPEPFPSGRGYEIPAGAGLVAEVHYKKTWLDEGMAVTDQSSFALYLHDERGGAQPVDTVAVSAGSAHTLETNAELVALLPRLDAEVESVVAEIVSPDGSRERILRLYQPSPDWPRKYWLAEPLMLSSGSRVEVTTTPDASVAVVLDLVRR